MALIKHRTRYFPYFNILQDEILMKRHSFKDPILFDIDWFLKNIAALDDRELLKIGEFQNMVRNRGFVRFYKENVLDSYFRSMVRNIGDDENFILRFRETVQHLKFFFNVLIKHGEFLESFESLDSLKSLKSLDSRDVLGCQQAIAWLEAEWEAKTDAELQSWVDSVIEAEGFGTEVFIDFASLTSEKKRKLKMSDCLCRC